MVKIKHKKIAVSIVIILMVIGGLYALRIRNSKIHALELKKEQQEENEKTNDTIKYSKKSINVTMDVIPETIDENNTKFKITTNLPDNTVLGIKVSNDKLNYSKQQMITMLSGQVETDSFNSNNFSLPNGDYSIKIVTAIESTQDSNSVRAILGKNGCNLRGDYISDSKNGQDKIVEFTKNVTITDSQTNQYDAQPVPKIGMTKDELLGCNWGKPENINKTTTANGIKEQWCYSGYRYIYVENGIVTTIQSH